MNTCPKCKEINPRRKRKCWTCGSSLAPEPAREALENVKRERRHSANETNTSRSESERGWAVLENRVKAMLREARRRYKVQLTLRAKCNEWGKASAAGRIGALADVQDAIAEAQRHGEERPRH